MGFIFGYGVFRFDRDLNLIKHYTVEDGVADGYIYSMVSDRNQSLWALSENDLYCYNAEKIALLPSVTKATGHWNLHYMQERPTQKVLFTFPEIKAYYVLTRPGWRKTLISLPYI